MSLKNLILLLLLLSFSIAAVAQDSDDGLLSASKNRWLVKFGKEVKESDIKGIAYRLGAEYKNLGPWSDCSLLIFPNAPGPQQIRQLQETPGLVYAEMEGRFQTTVNYEALGEDDPLEYLQWSHKMINLNKAHVYNLGADPGVLIAILDSGIAYTPYQAFGRAPDLAGTIIYDGYDFVSDDNMAVDEGDGQIGHGTFLAGVVAQTTYNRRGTSGIAFNSSLLPVRVVNRRGFARASDLARGIRYAVANGASIVLLGVAGVTDNRAVKDAVDFAYANNIPVIAPAGNSEFALYPAVYDNVLSVGAVDAAGDRAYYSPSRGAVDILAPGGDMRPGIDADGNGVSDGIIAESFLGKKFKEFKHILVDGTSPAAAITAGTAALLISQKRGITPDSLYYLLCSKSRKGKKIPLLNAGRVLSESSAIGR